MESNITDLGKVFRGRAIIKDCFECHKKGHHLSKVQFAKVKVGCREKLIHSMITSGIKYPTVSEDKVMEKVWEHIEYTGMLCDLCKGKKYLVYPHN